MKAKMNERAILLLIAGIYITPYLLRDKVFPDVLYPLNILSWIGILLFLRNNYKGYGRLTLRRIKHKSLIIGVEVAIALVLLMFVSERTGLGLQGYFKLFIAVLAPIIVLYLTFENYTGFDRIYSRMLAIVNISTIFIVLCGLIDVVSSYVVSTFFTNLYNVDSLYSMLNSGRIVSYFGHSLLTAEMLLIYYLLNFMKWNCISKKHNMVIPIVIAVIGIGLTGSKTAIVLILLMILITFFNLRMMRYAPVVLLAGFLLYRFGIFNLVSERFIYGLSTGDLSTGRNTMMQDLFSSGKYQFYLFRGNSETITGNELVAATEYPIVRWAFRNGIFFTVLISIVIFLQPIIRFFKRKNLKVFLMVLVLIVDVNSYSTLPGTMDGMFIYCTTLFLAYNALKYSQEVAK